MKNVSIETFRLKKIKLMDHLGLEVIYTEKITMGDDIHWVEKSQKSTIQRHPDVDKVVNRLRIHVVRIYAMLSIGMYKPEVDLNTKEQKALEGLLEDINVIGVTLSGDEETTGAIISAKKKVMGNLVVTMNTPTIKYENSQYEFGWDLKETIDELRKEIFEYIFLRKSAQLELFQTGKAA